MIINTINFSQLLELKIVFRALTKINLQIDNSFELQHNYSMNN